MHGVQAGLYGRMRLFESSALIMDQATAVHASELRMFLFTMSFVYGLELGVVHDNFLEYLCNWYDMLLYYVFDHISRLD